MSKKCPKCEKQSFTPFSMGSTMYADVYKCNVCGAECMVTQLEDITLFDRITASSEVLAEKLVYQTEDEFGDVTWSSTIVSGWYVGREDCIAATVKKLKEVAG